METIQVEIFGQTYTLKGGADPERVRELASYVNSRMKEVQKGSGVSDGYRVAILAALNIADDLHRIQRAQQALQKTTIHSLEKLLELTEDQAAEGK